MNITPEHQVALDKIKELERINFALTREDYGSTCPNGCDIKYRVIIKTSANEEYRCLNSDCNFNWMSARQQCLYDQNIITTLEHKIKELERDVRMGDMAWTSQVDKNETLEVKLTMLHSIIDEIRLALEFYGCEVNWLYNQIKKSDCSIITFDRGKNKTIPKGLEFESAGLKARETLALVDTKLKELKLVGK